jgi:hypothetical protein
MALRIIVLTDPLLLHIHYTNKHTNKHKIIVPGHKDNDLPFNIGSSFGWLQMKMRVH